MKKIYFLFFFISGLFANAQDAFITKWQTSSSDLNVMVPLQVDNNTSYTVNFGDGVILTNQTTAVSHHYSSAGTYTMTLSGNFNKISVDYFDRSQLKSVEQWGNTVWTSMENAFLECSNLVINATDVPNLSSVTSMAYMFKLTTSFNQSINNWDVSNVTDMTQLFSGSLYNQPLENWDVSNVTNMKFMFQNSHFNQPINNWDVSNVTNMVGVFLGNSSFNQPLNDWNVSNVTNMTGMFHYAANFNQDLSGWSFNPSLLFVYPDIFYETGFVGFSGMDSQNYDALLYRFAQLGLQNRTLYAQELEYCEKDIHDYLINELGWTIVQDSQSEECIQNTLLGNVLFDQNANGCDVNDAAVSSFFVLATNTNNMFTYAALAAPNGTFSRNVPEGEYTFSLLNLPEYFTVSPSEANITFDNVGEQETVNFCITANESISDLNVTLLPLEEARPGFLTDYQLVVQNMGTQNVTNATVNLTFDNALQTFVSANPAPASTTVNQLTFTLTNLQPFQMKKINLTMQLFTPPVVNGNEISNFTATVTPDANDFTPEDNTFELAQIVVNSYDPNDKRVLQGEEIFESETDNYLNYIIRFQNTGSASALTVKIKDVLHENLDWNTLQIVSASHNYKVEIQDGNKVEFIFNNINLPHEAGNESASHGFIAYKIKPVSGIDIGDVMSGNASIYFDYNLPIITNVASTTVVADIEPLMVTADTTNVSCNGANDATAEVVATGGSGSYTYSWSPVGGSESTAENLSAGNYTVTVTDTFGNVSVLNIEITQPEAIVINNQPDDVELTVGDNAVIFVEASNAEGYQWQVSSDGNSWNNISEGGTAPMYSGTTTAILSLSGVPLSYNGFRYKVILSNGYNCTTESSEAILEVDNVTGVKDFDSLGIKMYPNPSKNEVFVDIPNITEYENLKISVFDINGRILVEESIFDNHKRVNVCGFESGVYIFTITSNELKLSKYIIKE